MKNSVSIYACGGTGINIAKNIDLVGDTSVPGFADRNVFYIDTSTSNISKEIEESDAFYRVTGTEQEPINGSGMVRRANHKAINRAVPEILKQMRPGTLNIVLHSGSGGSGSVIGPELVSELMNRNQAVVVITVGSSSCIKEITNTADTIKSYQSIAKLRAKPVMLSYHMNERSMSEVNSHVCLEILFLMAIWSGENFALDTADLFNFLNYTVPAPNYPPALTSLEFCFGDDRMKPAAKGESIAAILTIVREGEEPYPGLKVGYHTFGTLSEAASNAINVDTPAALRAVQGVFVPIVSQLDAELAALQEDHRAAPTQELVVSSPVEDSGIVL